MSEDTRRQIAERFAEAGLNTTRFIKCRPGQKASVNHDRAGYTEVSGEYGIYALPTDNLVIIDIDDYEDIEDKSGLTALHGLPPTFEQASPHGGTHQFYAVEPTDDGLLAAAALEREFGTKNPAPSWGEVRTANQYVVGASSQLDDCDKDWCDECETEDGGYYEIQEDREIAVVDADLLINVLAQDPKLEPKEHQPEPEPVEIAGTDDERLDLALDRDNKLERLWRGDYTAYGGDRSRAESALAMKLGWWFQGDKQKVRQLMDQANTQKWSDREDDSYRDSVLTAVDELTDYYTPPRERTTSAKAAADGGTATETPTDDSGPTIDIPLWERVRDEVLTPLDPPEDWQGDEIDDETARDRLCDLIEEEYHFLRPREDTRGWRDTLYVYSDEDGIYEPHGESFIQTEVERLVGAWSTNQRVREIVGKIERRSRVNKRELLADPQRLVVKNGILDLTTGDLVDHDPEEYHQTMINVKWNPDAECPKIDEFLHEVVEPQDVPKLYRLIAHALYKEYAAEKAAMLLGDGRNGKSVFLSLVETFLGNWNVSNQSLQALNEDEWAANNLVGKLANVHPDMSDQTVQTMQMFKKLTGRDTVSANVKFEEPIRFENHATLVFACNRMPVLKDDTRGNWRRWILIDFPNTFEPDADSTEEKQVIMDRITSEEELQGLLVRCVEEIQAWDDGRAWFPSAPSWEQARKRIRRAAEPVYDFAHACLEDKEGYETTDNVRRAYQEYASIEGLPPMSRENFGRELLSQTDYTIEKKQKRIDGTRKQVYEGVVFTSRGRQLSNGGTEEESDNEQDLLGGPEGRASRIVDLVDDYDDGEGMSHDMILGMAVTNGMTVDQAEAAIERAKTQGGLQPAPSGGITTTR